MPRSPRTLTVLVGTLPIEDGQTPPPVVGEVGRYWLLFVEATHDEPDATVVTVQARAEPIGDGSPLRCGLMWDGTVRDEPPHWPTMLHGNGWSASWSAPRPVVGEMVVRGTVLADLGFCAHGSVRGRVTRARAVTETFDTTDPDHPRIPALQRLREVDTGPRWFDHGRAPNPGGRGTVPRDPYEVETGVLVDLDLDDVPPCPCGPRSCRGHCRRRVATSGWSTPGCRVWSGLVTAGSRPASTGPAGSCPRRRAGGGRCTPTATAVGSPARRGPPLRRSRSAHRAGGPRVVGRRIRR